MGNILTRMPHAVIGRHAGLKGGNYAKIFGTVSPGLSGNLEGISGDLTGIYGEIGQLRGNVTGIRGKISGINGLMSQQLTGDVSGLYGMVNLGLIGNATGVFGDVTGWQGNLDAVTKQQRARGIDIEELGNP